LTRLRRLVARGGDLTEVPKTLDVLASLLHGPSQAEVRGLRPLVEAAQARPLSDQEKRELEERLARAAGQVRQEYQLEQRQLRQLRRARSRQETGPEVNRAPGR
jgi:hypothetical protein